MESFPFNLENQVYSDFILFLRSAMGKPVYLNGSEILLLPLSKDVKDKGQAYFVVILRSCGKGMRYLLKRETLYLLAVKPDSNLMPWIVLTDDKRAETIAYLREFDKIVLNGIEILPIKSRMGMSYDDLKKYGKKRKNIKLGRYQIEASILGLQRFTGSPNEKFAAYLLVSIQSISEAIRFKIILEFIITHFEEGQAPGELNTNVDINWAQISKYILALVREKIPECPMHVGGSDLTEEQILAYIAVILNSEENKERKARRKSV